MRIISHLRKLLSKESMLIEIDAVNPKPRWTPDNPNMVLLNLIADRNIDYSNQLRKFLDCEKQFQKIDRDFNPLRPLEPNWNNDFIPCLDAISLYSFISIHHPRRFLEIGSGNSTKFAYRAIQDNKLPTKIISIDPQPRAEIDQICDEIFRQPAEEVDLELFKELESGDILFIDNSHRVFTNSDATTIFLDVLPILKSGVIVEFHDIFLPYDYPNEWNRRFYSEQYLLAAYLLGGKGQIEILLPNAYISQNTLLHNVLSPIWANPKISDCVTGGASFWIKM
jgi:hypothetical protein